MIAWLVLITFVSSCLISVATAQQPPADVQQRAVQRRLYHEGLAQYPLLTQKRVEDVFRLRADEASLILEPMIEADREYQQHRGEFAGFADPASVLCWLTSQDLGQIKFEFAVDDYGRKEAVARLQISATPSGVATVLDVVELTKTWQTPTGFRRIYFKQVGTNARLEVFANDGGPNEFVNLSIEEKDFATLRRMHRAEMDRWVRPIMEDLHQYSAFAADERLAWQVLSEEWPGDTGPTAAMAEQIKLLNDDNFSVRRKASQTLAKCGRDGALRLIRMSRVGLSAEQNIRIDEVIGRYKLVPDSEARKLHSDVSFLVDCLYGEEAIARDLALRRLNTLRGEAFQVDFSLPYDKRIKSLNALREQILKPASNGATHPGK